VPNGTPLPLAPTASMWHLARPGRQLVDVSHLSIQEEGSSV